MSTELTRTEGIEERRNMPWWNRFSVVGLWLMAGVLGTLIYKADSERRDDSGRQTEALMKLVEQTKRDAEKTIESLKWHHIQMSSRHQEIMKRMTSIENRLKRDTKM